jgi:hypothetical protein
MSLTSRMNRKLSSLSFLGVTQTLIVQAQLVLSSSEELVGLDNRDMATVRQVHGYSVAKWNERFAKISEVGQSLLAKQSQNFSVILIDETGTWRARVGTNVRIEFSKKGAPGDVAALLACLELDIYRLAHPDVTDGLSHIYSKDFQRRVAANATNKQEVAAVRAATSRINTLVEGDPEARERILTSVGNSLASEFPTSFVVELQKDGLVSEAMTKALRVRQTQLERFQAKDFFAKEPTTAVVYQNPEFVWEKVATDAETGQEVFTTKIGPDTNVFLVGESADNGAKIIRIRSLKELKEVTTSGDVQGFYSSPWDKKPSKLGDAAFEKNAVPRD